MSWSELRDNRKAIFDHIRNILIASTLLIASIYGASNPLLVTGERISGILIVLALFLIGVFLLALNADELIENEKLKKNRFIGAAFLIMYTVIIIQIGKALIGLRLLGGSV